MHIGVLRTLGSKKSAICFLRLRGPACCQAWRCYGDVTLPGETAATNAASGSFEELPDVFDMDETMKLNVYRHYSSEEQPQKDATGRFLFVIITTFDEQEWKDMLSAAIRLNTLREHHVRAVIRSLHQAQYDVHNVAGTGDDRLPRGDRQSTPATRLQRAVNIVQTAVDEGYKVAPESVHALLVTLLRGLSCGSIDSPMKTDGKSNVDGPQQSLVSRTTVWRFLAWMELHNYHVLSTAVLDALELIIEDDVLEKKSTEQKLGVRQNRLEYLRKEHNRLISGANTLQQGGAKGRGTPRPILHEKSGE